MRRMLIIAILTAVNLLFRIRQIENMRQLLFNGSNTAGIFAGDDIGDDFRQLHPLFLHDLPVLYDIDGDLVINIAQHV